MGRDRRDKKKPAKGYNPKGSKEPALGVDPDQAAKTEHLSWRLSMLDIDGGILGWRQCALTKIEEIHEKLCHHEKMTLTEFHTRRGNHPIPVWKLEKVARDRLNEIGLDDVEELFEIHITGVERIWGTVTGPIFNLLWWDPGHEAYKVFKKHT